MSTAVATQMKTTGNCDLREWLKDVKRLEQLEQISGAHWDLELGALTEIILERIATPPAVVFDNVPGFDPNRRVLVNMLETLERTALTLNLPLDLKIIPLIDALRARLRAMQPITANVVSDGPIFENIERGDQIDLTKFPVPRWHVVMAGVISAPRTSSSRAIRRQVSKMSAVTASCCRTKTRSGCISLPVSTARFTMKRR